MSKNEHMREASGIRAGRARRQRLWIVILTAIAIGAAVDAILIPMMRHAPAGAPTLPPLIGSVAAVALVLLLNLGTWIYLRFADELEYQDNLVAFSVGLLFNLSAYVAWLMLNFGGLAPRPSADLLFLSTGIATALAYGWRKLRHAL
jgi:uncharacterized membrane protein YhaH (DUF805 family)